VIPLGFRPAHGAPCRRPAAHGDAPTSQRNGTSVQQPNGLQSASPDLSLTEPLVCPRPPMRSAQPVSRHPAAPGAGATIPMFSGRSRHSGGTLEIHIHFTGDAHPCSESPNHRPGGRTARVEAPVARVDLEQARGGQRQRLRRPARRGRAQGVVVVRLRARQRRLRLQRPLRAERLCRPAPRARAWRRALLRKRQGVGVYCFRV
jgi:hypothetical protein